MRHLLRGIAAALVLVTASAGYCEDWPGFRGAGRDGRSTATGLLKSWPKDGPKLLWSAKGLGKGYSSAAVAGEKVYTVGMSDGEGYLFAYDLAGKRLWKKQYGPEYTGRYAGARCTPTIDDGRVYVTSGQGVAACLNAATGEKIWSMNMLKKFGGKNLRWGLAESVLIVGDKAILTPGGPNASVVAVNKKTGETIWKTKGLSDSSGYCSPMLVTLKDRKLIVTMTKAAVVGIDAADGKVLWRHPWRNQHGNHPDTPLYEDGIIYAACGYGKGSVTLKLSADGKTVKKLWDQKQLDPTHGGVVLVDGTLYGSGHKRKWFSVNAASGEVTHTAEGVGKGSVIYADGMLYCYGERGKLGLVKPGPQSHEVVSSFTITAGGGEHWAHPTIADKRLYIRHGDVMMVYDIAASK